MIFSYKLHFLSRWRGLLVPATVRATLEVALLPTGSPGAETWTLCAVDQKLLEIFEIWCCRRMEKISWTDHMRNEEVLLRVKEQRNILHEISKRKAYWIGHVLCRDCLLRHVIEGKIKGGIEAT
jgi:hypothetical protein